MKKQIFILVLLVCLVFAGCGKSQTAKKHKGGADQPTEETTQQPTQEQMVYTFKRMESVTIHQNDQEPQTYAVTWNDGVCSFTMTENGWDPCLTEADFDPETGAFWVHRKPENADFNDTDAVNDIALCNFDDQQRLIRLWGGPYATEYVDVSYDAEGWPEENLQRLTVDKENRQYSVPRAGMVREDADGNQTITQSYHVVTVDSLGNAVRVDQLEITTHPDGSVEENRRENIETHTYDADGNLIKYEYEGGFVELTYSDESISHMWERLIPFLCFDFSWVYFAPLFWNVQ